MPNIARLYDFQPGAVILDNEVDDELNQLVTTVNALPDKDGTLQASLNADKLDGFDASASGGTDKIPVCNGTLQTALNAEFLGGLAASDIAAAGFPAGTRLIFATAGGVPAGWTEVSRPAVDRVLGWGKTAAPGENNSASAWSNIATYFGVEVGPHALTISEMPAHNHAGVIAASVPPLGYLAAGTDFAEVVASGITGGGGTHTHAGSGLNNGSQPAANYRPPIHWTVIGSKN